MSNASIVWRSDDKDVIASLQKMEKRVETLIEQNKRLKEASKQAGDAAKKGADDAANSAAKAYGQISQTEIGLQRTVLGYFGMKAAIDLVNTSLQHQLTLQDEVAGTQKTAADAQIKFLRNLGNVSQGEREGAIKEIGAISQRTGVNEAQLYTAASSAMSARGGLTIKQALAAVEQGAVVAPEDPGETTAVAAGLLDLASLTKSADAKRNLGLLVSMQQQARNVNIQSVAKNLVPGAISLASYGASTEESVAAVTSMTQAMKDPEGAISSTAMIALAQQAEKITPGGFGEDIAKLKSDPAARDAFLAKASFEKKAASFVKSFLTEGSETSNLYESYKESLPTAEAAPKAADEFIAGIKSPELQQAENFRRKFATQADSKRLDDLRSGDYSRMRTAISGLAESAGTGWFESTEAAMTGRLSAMMGASPEEAGLKQVETLEKVISKQQTDNDIIGNTRRDEQLEVLQGIKAELTAIKEAQKTKQLNVNAHSE